MNYQGMICTLRDTSDSYATFRLLLETIEHIQDAVVILRHETPSKLPAAFFANKKFREIFDLQDIDPFSLQFEKLTEVIKENSVNKDEWEQFIHQNTKQGNPSTEFAFELTNGKKYLAAGNPIHDRQGTVIGKMATIREEK